MRLEIAVEDLRVQTLRVLTENPFERSGQTRELELIKQAMARQTEHHTSELGSPEQLAIISTEYWSLPPELLRHRFELFESST